VLTNALIKRMARENPLWGAPRIHGELLRLGIAVAEATVAKYMPRRRPGDRGPSWRTFIANEFDGISAIDFLTVRTVLFEGLHVLVVLSLTRRRIALIAVTGHPTALWLAQQISRGVSMEHCAALSDPRQ
jgi:putative transposase